MAGWLARGWRYRIAGAVVLVGLHTYGCYGTSYIGVRGEGGELVLLACAVTRLGTCCCCCCRCCWDMAVHGMADGRWQGGTVQLLGHIDMTQRTGRSRCC
ncbi:uncharacterized protein K452DRAFT_7894 [Aplosporella prunicola CBS 121167]|uniref:Uncharacterized protein n=1 Tax=Aplosporella prunicola CBS 121167 TaxID=1176127 RepID=A0A6A6BXL0_9PEZI|nr:uncharacterized protein K452DRAFT_7894 [Aplosporella prunicola CBS 121167]KAF2147471.1 hypothetical protein K452DRAFT_7894 [Aplosporella prunicola CBS 121167]